MTRIRGLRKTWFSVNTPISLIAGTRNSKLAELQSISAINRIQQIFPRLTFSLEKFSSPGDRDLICDLKTAPENFFTKDLDNAILSEKIDLAIHSAKDLPKNLPEEINFFLLPWSEDSHDCLVFSQKYQENKTENPIVGVSSERRENYAKNRFKNCQIKSLRGNIEQRLEKLDAGEFDIIIMAVAALKRLGLENRINEIIQDKNFEVPENQGKLAITYSKKNVVMSELARFFQKKYTEIGSLRLNKILLTGGEKFNKQAAELIKEHKGVPYIMPIMRCVPENDVFDNSVINFDRIILTSVESVDFFAEKIKHLGISPSSLPPIDVSGPGTNEAMKIHGLIPANFTVERYGKNGLIAKIADEIHTGQNILRLRSNRSSFKISYALKELGATVTDRILYKNEAIENVRLNNFDAVFFASARAVEIFVNSWGKEYLQGKYIVALSKEPYDKLCEMVKDCQVIIASEPTIEAMISVLVEINYFREQLLLMS